MCSAVHATSGTRNPGNDFCCRKTFSRKSMGNKKGAVKSQPTEKKAKGEGTPVASEQPTWPPCHGRSSLKDFQAWMRQAGISWDESLIHIRVGKSDADAELDEPDGPWAVHAGEGLGSQRTEWMPEGAEEVHRSMQMAPGRPNNSKLSTAALTSTCTRQPGVGLHKLRVNCGLFAWPSSPLMPATVQHASRAPLEISAIFLPATRSVGRARGPCAGHRAPLGGAQCAQ